VCVPCAGITQNSRRIWWLLVHTPLYRNFISDFTSYIFMFLGVQELVDDREE